MSCRRAFDIDLAAYLADPREEEFAAFREHYPRCSACAGEVRVWTELRARLAAGSRTAHPEPRLLLRYQADPAQLEPNEQYRVSAHLESCASCRDELATLRGFDPGALAAPSAAAPSRPDPGALLDFLRRLLWHPGFAYALALLVTAPSLYLWMTPDSPLLREGSTAVAQEERSLVLFAEGAVRTEERLLDVPAQELPLASSLEEQGALEYGAVAQGAPSPAAPARSPQRARAPEAAGAEPAPEPRAHANAQLSVFAEGFVEKAEPDELRTDALRALGYVSPAAEPEPGGGVAAPTLSLEDLGGGVFALRVPVDPAAREVEIRVVSPDGRRELMQRFGGGASEVELRIPASWLEPGTQRVERRLDDRTQVFPLEVP